MLKIGYRATHDNKDILKTSQTPYHNSKYLPCTPVRLMMTSSTII